MLIGVSSQNFRTITSHAGKGRRFFVYEVDDNGEINERERIELSKAETMHETPLGTAHVLDRLDVLLTGGAGAGFLNKMAERNVKVVMTSLTDPLDAVQAYVAGKTLPAPTLNEHFATERRHRHADE